MDQPLIALLTDFGTSDPYVGVMKGVMATRCAAARTIDITHEVSPQNIRQAAYLLRSAYRYFPAHTIFLVVIDPSVGMERRPVAIQASHGLFVGPDNGVFSAVLDEVDTWQAVALWPPETVSSTFHGRDVFAPVAARLACGSTLTEIGSPIVDLERIAVLRVDHSEPSTLVGEVLHIDHFGNVITSLGPFEWQKDTRNLLLDVKSSQQPLAFRAATAEVVLGTRRLTGIAMTYGEARQGDLLALINSDRQLEIAVNQGNAAWLLGCHIGDSVQIDLKAQGIE
jgi:S-adenosyl-L-methionine hydrolase (adenosine-forming)